MNVQALVAELEGMGTPPLRERYREVFGEAARSFNKRFLVKRIAWRTQALAEGGLSERALRRAAELARDADIRLRPPKDWAPDATGPVATLALPGGGSLKPGSVLRREYKGRVVLVRVLDRGFEYGGKEYRSLTAVAREVTGSHWNGHLFFGTRPAKGAA